MPPPPQPGRASPPGSSARPIAAPRARCATSPCRGSPVRPSAKHGHTPEPHCHDLVAPLGFTESRTFEKTARTAHPALGSGTKVRAFHKATHPHCQRVVGTTDPLGTASVAAQPRKRSMVKPLLLVPTSTAVGVLRRARRHTPILTSVRSELRVQQKFVRLGEPHGERLYTRSASVPALSGCQAARPIGATTRFEPVPSFARATVFVMKVRAQE